MNIVFITIVVITIIGIFAAVVLYFVAKRFHVYEDPKIGEIESCLPGANCGGCGRSGCHDFAVACASAKTLDDLACPVGGQETMSKISEIVGLSAKALSPQVAIIRCNGTCENRPHTSNYEGVGSCAIEGALYEGETDCIYGCLGGGDCVAVCPYDAMSMNEETGLPTVDYSKCVGCGKCVQACPRHIPELVKRHEVMVYVACGNKDKGPLATKVCSVSCIGCGKCVRVCQQGAVKVTDFLARIDRDVCTACGECIVACPRHSILCKQKIED